MDRKDQEVERNEQEGQDDPPLGSSQEDWGDTDTGGVRYASSR